jgi:hypothetical protein
MESTEITAPAAPAQTLRQRATLIAVGLLVVAAVIRIGLVPRTTLWADALFSLAAATGHSPEHKPDVADASKGDYVEVPDPADPDVYRQYLRHDSTARVVRAVFQSDASPPLYYLLVYGWTRVFGTSDWALRMFSVTAALACFPLIWSIGRQLAGIPGALAACALYTLSPTAIYYATEGRMYSLLWLFTLCSMAMTLRIWRHGSDVRSMILWVLSAAAGLMTYYFFIFIFVFAALCAGLMLVPRRASRWKVLGGRRRRRTPDRAVVRADPRDDVTLARYGLLAQASAVELQLCAFVAVPAVELLLAPRRLGAGD